MTKEYILEIVKKNGLFRYNIYDDHLQKANEVSIKIENNQYIVFLTDENNLIKDKILTFSDKNEALDNFIMQLQKLKDLYLSAFIGDNYLGYYKDKFKNKPLNKLFISWKWPPFFLGFGWLIYRKMYLETLILFFCNVIISSIIVFFIYSGNRVSQNVYDSIRIILSLFGNSLYYFKINRVLKKLGNIDEKEHILYLNKHGGTNIVIAIIVALLYVALIIIPYLI